MIILEDLKLKKKDVWNFLRSTHIDYNLLHILDRSSKRIAPNDYIYENVWEKRYNFNKLEYYWNVGCTFVVHSSNVTENLRNFVVMMENHFMRDIHSHIYMGKYNSVSFPIHSDKPDNLIYQCEGKSEIKIYKEYADEPGFYFGKEELHLERKVVLCPGEYVIIPSYKYHHFKPLTDRMSISFPFSHSTNGKKIEEIIRYFEHVV